MTQTPGDTLDAAHAYARRGWGVVPLFGITEDGNCRCRAGAACPPKSRGKHPSTGARWQELALTGGANVQAWYDEHPDDNVGILTGPESGIFVFDVDGVDGIRSVTAFAAEHGALPATRIVQTGSGGLHYFFTHPGHFVVHNSTSYLAKGIDIRGKGGQVVAPPSTSGRGPYKVLADYDVAAAPEWLLQLLAEHAGRVERGHKADVVSAQHVDLELLPERVANLVRQHVGMDEGRFKHFHAIVAAIYEAGFTQGQAVTITAPWCAAVGKFVGRVEQEVARCWGKLEDEAARANEWVEGLGDRPTTPEIEGTWSTTSTTSSSTPPSAGSTADTSPGSSAERITPVPTASPSTKPTASSHDEPPADLPATWAAINLDAILDGTYQPETPALFPRTDGHNLVYPGRVHSFHGESESGKSLIAQAEVARVLADGGRAAYIDFEADAGAVVGRLLEMGAPVDALRERFTYRRPDADPFAFPREREAFAELLTQRLDLVIVDGVTDALSVFGAGSNDMDEVTMVMRRFQRRVATRTGAAVIQIDHVAKDADTRGRHAVGSQAKLNGLDGSAFVIEVAEPLGRGMRGVVVMRVGKDRPGGVRPISGAFRKGDRTQEAARVVVDSTGEGIRVTVTPPESGQGATLDDGRQLRPGWLTLTMERVSETLESSGESLSGKQVETSTKGKASAVRAALKTLVDDGFAAIERAGQYDRFTSSAPYRSAEDELSEDYLGWANSGMSRPGSSHLVPPSSPEEGRPLVPVPLPLRGGDEVGEGGTSSTSSQERDEVFTVREVSCKSCFRPTPEVIADTFEGRCGSCARDAGLV